MRVRTYPNTLPEVWHPDAERVPDDKTPPLIHQGAPPRVFVHCTQLLGDYDRENRCHRLPTLDELREWYEREPYPYTMVYAHRDLTSKAYKTSADGDTQQMLSQEDVYDGYTALLSRRPLTRMATAMRGASRTGGVACNYGSPVTVQIAILGCSEDAQIWTDRFYADFGDLLASTYQTIRDRIPGEESIEVLPYQTDPGHGGGWGDGLAKALGGTGRKTGGYRMSKAESASGVKVDGGKWNYAGHIHALSRNTHWDPSSYFRWQQTASRANSILDGRRVSNSGPAPISKITSAHGQRRNGSY